ncbi:MAG: radical SAM protein, partial [Bacteroidota bacterium]
FATHNTCNLKCRHCYIPFENRKEKKTEDSVIISSLEEFIKKIESENYQIGKFCLHGTEPTLLSATNLAKVVGMVDNHWQKTQTKNISVAVQTNGVRLNRGYLEELADKSGSPEKIKLGFSIDPPVQVHNFMRDNSYDTVFLNYNTAIELGFKVGVLMVVSQQTMNFLDEFRDWVVEQSLRMKEKGNPFKIKLKFATGKFSISDDDMDFFTYFLIENNLLNLVQILTPGYCMQSGNECMWFEFDFEGNVYSCNKSYGSSGTFSNWRVETFSEIVAIRKKLYTECYVSSDCKECCMEVFCNSGCPLDRIKVGTLTGKAHECTLIRNVYKYLDSNNIVINEFLNNIN